MPPTQKIVIPGGFEVPIPRWTKHFFGIIAVAAISFGSYRYFYPVEPELISIKQAMEQLKLEVQEYNKHIVDTPLVALANEDRTVSVAAFEDGCLLVSRRFAGASFTRLLVEQPRASAPRASIMETVMPTLEASEAQGRCMNQHPGRFQWVYGVKRDRCWVPVIRTFEDGCQHQQLFNTCSGSWATNSDGSPQIHWTRCVH